MKSLNDQYIFYLKKFSGKKTNIYIEWEEYTQRRCTHARTRARAHTHTHTQREREREREREKLH